jgi:hypothetical protein
MEAFMLLCYFVGHVAQSWYAQSKDFFQNPIDNLGGIDFPIGFNNGKKQITSFDMVEFLIQSLILSMQRRV